MSARKDRDLDVPPLQTDADVDALMARLRARLQEPATSPAGDESDQAPLAATLDDLIAAHDGLASSVVRAMEAIVDTLEDMAADGDRVFRHAPRLSSTGPRRRARR